ncbi:ABC transporter transmembrane domain-containing protein [Cellulosilyticum ruminicola]|uniref:ABC transporter transmembrane domain-containing protein n=1 Tax=Cellulosilyticum ruminicola TaxID=425254 RepID=UPI0006D0CE85|nr:ABC transporter transmembrane domain-containing protein [Cellulosilyticum ruminicola]
MVKKIEVRASKYRQKYGEHIGWLYEILSGLKEIRLLNSTIPVNRRFTKDTVDLTRIKGKIAVDELTAERLNTGVCLICMLIIYIVGSLKVEKGEMTLGEITAIIWYFNLLKTSLIILSQRMIGAKKMK